MRKKLKFINKLASNTVLLLSLIFSIGMIISNMLFISKSAFQGSIRTYLFSILIVCILAAIIYFLVKIKNRKRYIISLFFIAFILRLIWILLIDTQPISDFDVMYNGAKDIVGGNKEALLNNRYFISWVYQLGHTVYLAGLYKIFGGSLIAIKVVNVFISSLIVVVLYKTIRVLCSEMAARVGSLWYAVYIGSIGYTSVLTNQHLTTLLCYLALYFLITRFEKKYFFILIGILFGLAHIIRPEGTIVLFALLLFMIFKDFTFDKKNIINILKSLGIIIIVSIIIQLFSSVLISSGITRYKYENRDPLWKFVTGLNYETTGMYSKDDDDILYYIDIGDEKRSIQREMIRERISNPKRLGVLMGKKFVTFWGGDDTSFSFIYTDEETYNKYNDMSVRLEKVQYFIVILIMGVGILNMCKMRSFEKGHLYLIILLGYVFAHLIIEIQVRYRYFIIPTLIVIAAYGVDFVLDKYNKKFR